MNWPAILTPLLAPNFVACRSIILERPMRTLILIALALLSGCASGHNYGGALLLGIFLPDPDRLTAEDREIMAREQAEADAAERREVGR